MSNMRLDDYLKTLFIILLFMGAAWSATLWPSKIIVEVTKPLVDGVIVEGEYTDIIVLDGVEVHTFTDDEFVYIGLRSAGSGWVAIGFSPVDVHSGANFLLGAVVDGVILVSDEYGSSPYEHVSDVSLGGTSDIVEFAGKEMSGTVIELKILLDSGDVYDTVLEKGNVYSVIVAYHESMDDFMVTHTERFRLSLLLH